MGQYRAEDTIARKEIAAKLKLIREMLADRTRKRKVIEEIIKKWL